jgi:hypothetical protein
MALLLFFIALTYLSEEFQVLTAGDDLFCRPSARWPCWVYRVILRNIVCALRARGFNLRPRARDRGRSGPGEHAASAMERFPELGLRIVGIATQDGARDRLMCGRPVLGSFDDVPRADPQQPRSMRC